MDKVGGILGADTYIVQSWNNCVYSLKGNSFTGTVKATGEKASYIGGIIGYYASLNRIDDISNNYYKEGCGAEKGIGFVPVSYTHLDVYKRQVKKESVCIRGLQ